MCIIIYKPIGQELPGKDILKNCFESNKDGAGYMFNTGQDVFIKKGFFNHNSLLSSLKQNIKNLDLDIKEIAVAIHCRIATAGLVKPENCHPFPISENIGDLQALNYRSNIAVCHNGCLSIHDDKYKNLSDTQIFIKDILSQIDINNEVNFKLLDLALSGSKLLIFDKGGHFLNFGDWIEDKGIYYSNSGYEKHDFMSSRNYYEKDYHEKDYYEKDYYGRENKKENKKKNEQLLFNACWYCGKNLIIEEEIKEGCCLECDDIYHNFDYRLK